MDTITAQGDVSRETASLQQTRSCIELTQHSSQTMASSTTVDLESAVLRSIVEVAQAEPGTEPAINRPLFYAVCTGSLVVVACLVVVVFWYGVLTDPREMLLRAVGGGGVVAVAAVTPVVNSYAGVPQTHQPSGQWNDSSDSVATLSDNSPLVNIIGHYVPRGLLDNGTDDSQLLKPV